MNVEDKNKFDQITSENQKQSMKTTPDEDEIFELDTSILEVMPSNENNAVGVDKAKTEHQDLPDLNKQEVLLSNKNLFYELKFALKSKRNEWTEREKRAKRFNKNQQQQQQQLHVINSEILTIDDSHLLENEVLKYKSELRKRRQQLLKNETMLSSMLEKKEENDAVSYKNNKFFIENLQSANTNSISHSFIMNEFMQKRSSFFNSIAAHAESEEDFYE
jgi:hypothetical protein